MVLTIGITQSSKRCSHLLKHCSKQLVNQPLSISKKQFSVLTIQEPILLLQQLKEATKQKNYSLVPPLESYKQTQFNSLQPSL